MEFFRIVDTRTNEHAINELLTIKNLEEISSQLFLLDNESDVDTSNIGSLWGEFTLNLNTIKGGVRFALKECPNALTWTVTTGYPPAPEAVIIHLTINRIDINSEFKEEIEDFLNDHSERIKHILSTYHGVV